MIQDLARWRIRIQDPATGLHYRLCASAKGFVGAAGGDCCPRNASSITTQIEFLCLLTAEIVDVLSRVGGRMMGLMMMALLLCAWRIICFSACCP